MTKYACERLLDRMIGNQSAMNLRVWSSFATASGDDREFAAAAAVIEAITPELKHPAVKSIKLIASANGNEYDDEGGYYTSYSVSTCIAVDDLKGGVIDISEESDLDELDELLASLEENDDPRTKEYEAMSKSIQQFLDNLDSHDIDDLYDRDFWKYRDSVTVTRAEVDRATIDGKIDYVALAANLFSANQIAERSLSEAPVRWHDVTLEQLPDRLAAGMNPNAFDDAGQSPLNAALYHGNKLAVQQLLAAGANPNLVDASALAPVNTAIYQGRLAELDDLLAAGADLKGPNHAPAQLFALNTKYYHSPIPVSELIARGLDFTATMPDGWCIAETPERYTSDEKIIRHMKSIALCTELQDVLHSDDGDDVYVPRKSSSSLSMSL